MSNAQVISVRLSEVGVALILAEQERNNIVMEIQRWKARRAEANDHIEKLIERYAHMNSQITQLKGIIS